MTDDNKGKNQHYIGPGAYKEIISAVSSKSVLDVSTCSVSDDEVEDSQSSFSFQTAEHSDVTENARNDDDDNEDLKESLQFTLPAPSSKVKEAMPDIQDRKCVLGCLASILASYYDDHHENVESLDESPEMHKHLERRHLYFCEFLENCASLLYLEKSHARAFFPMLQRLLQQQHQRSTTSSNILSSDASAHSSSKNTQEQQQSSFKSSLSPSCEFIQPFLQTLTPGSGFLCITLLLTQHLLHSPRGYDARTRHSLKKLSLLILQHEYQTDAHSSLSKFEGLEVYIAQKLLEHHNESKMNNQKTPIKSSNNYMKKKSPKGATKDAVIRGLKITSAGVLAGTLFGITGGLAAPGIAAGLAAFAGSAALVTYTTASAVSILFGVGGGGLAAYKIHRRTRGLTEFTFQKETSKSHLHCVICMTGWLRDIQDFQRPWGVTPTKPGISEKEKLERFYSKVNPEHVDKCEKIASKWKGEERELHELLRNKYGVDPLRLWEGCKERYSLDEDEEGVVIKLLDALGAGVTQKSVKEIRKSNPNNISTKSGSSKFDFDHMNIITSRKDTRSMKGLSYKDYQLTPSKSTPELTVKQIRQNQALSPALKTSTPSQSSPSLNSSNQKVTSTNENRTSKRPPWSFTHRYSGELYTVKFESLLLLELCDSVTDLAVDLVGTATKELLKQTAIHALISAIALPVAMINAANMIDGTWTLAIERAEEAGMELAKILTSRKAGCRPVTLVGFSMGARAIYVCLKELARMQDEWTIDLDTREPASVVEDVIIMGMPNHLSLASWASIRRVVAGRVVNCYSSKDWIIGLMFQYKRMSGLGRRVCGTSKVQVSGVENYDVTSLIQSHGDYCVAVEDILKLVEFGLPRDLVNQGNYGGIEIEKGNEEDEKDKVESFENDELSSVAVHLDVHNSMHMLG